MSFFIVSANGKHGSYPMQMEFQIVSVADLSDLPKCAPGSIAYLDDRSRMWNLGNNGLWKEIRQVQPDGSVAVASAVDALESSAFETGTVVDASSLPAYVDAEHLADYAAYGITDTGWYVFARIHATAGQVVGDGFTVIGAAGYVMPAAGDDSVDVAVRFGVSDASRAVEVRWNGAVDGDRVLFKATQLAMRNIDSRATYYVYEISDYATWTWALTTDTAFVAGTRYYTKDGDVYTLAEVTAGDTVTADTYYVHTGVTFEGMPRNLSYMIDLIDCPVVIVLPEIEDAGYGAWFELQARYSKAFSVTLRVPEGVKMSSNGTQTTSAGVNIMTIQYFGSDKVWRLDNTKWPEPS